MYGNTDEPLLWGDDDVILLGYGNNANSESTAYVYAGDGDDLVDIHGNWHDTLVHGNRGNDTFVVDGGWDGVTSNTSDDNNDVMTIWGDLGDDIFKQGEDSIAINAAGRQNLSTITYLIGGEGNDKFEQFTGTPD